MLTSPCVFFVTRTAPRVRSATLSAPGRNAIRVGATSDTENQMATMFNRVLDAVGAVHTSMNYADVDDFGTSAVQLSASGTAASAPRCLSPQAATLTTSQERCM